MRTGTTMGESKTLLIQGHARTGLNRGWLANFSYLWGKKNGGKREKEGVSPGKM